MDRPKAWQPISQRQLKLLQCALGLTLILLLGAACTGASATADDGKLTVYDWSTYNITENPTFFGPFAEKYGDTLAEKVEFITLAEDGEALAKALSGQKADIVHPCNGYWRLWVENKLLQPIDTARLTNWNEINPALAALGQFDGKQYFVPWDYGHESMLVRTDLVEAPPKAWADLWDPQYAGRIAQFDSAESNFVIAALALGLDPYQATPEQHDQIKAKLIALKANVLTYWVDYTEAYDLPLSGDAAIVTNAWQDAYVNAVKEGATVEYVDPAEGRLTWVCGFGISANATDLDLVYEYLNAAFTPESMAAMANAYWYGAANTAAVDLIEDEIVQVMQLDQPETLAERSVFYQSMTEEQRQAVAKIWDEVKAAQ